MSFAQPCNLPLFWVLNSLPPTDLPTIHRLLYGNELVMSALEERGQDYLLKLPKGVGDHQ